MINLSQERYIQDIKKTTVLTREEEKAEFIKMRRGNKKSKEILITSNMRFVLQVALQYRDSGVPITDLVSEGAKGLITAVNKFDIKTNLKFISYAVWWIRAYIKKYINQKHPIIRISVNKQERIRKLRKNGAEIKDPELAELVNLSGHGVRFEAPIKNDFQKNSYADILPDNNAEDADESCYKTEKREIISQLLNQLSREEQTILKHHFELESQPYLSLEELSFTMRLSREQIRAIKKKAMFKLGNRIRRQYRIESFLL